MEQKPQSNKLARHPYVIDPKERIAHLRSLLDSSKPCYAKQGANINAAIALWENGYDGSKKIYLIDGKQIGSLEEALLHEGPVWIEEAVRYQLVQKAKYSYNPAEGGFELLLQCRLLTAYGAPGTITQVPVIYDTGSNILSLFNEDFVEMGWLLVPQYPAVGSIRICIADVSSSDFEKHLVQWRLAEPTTNIGWSAWVTEEAISRPSLPSLCRLSGNGIRENFYIGTGPASATLSVATTLGGMRSQLT